MYIIYYQSNDDNTSDILLATLSHVYNCALFKPLLINQARLSLPKEVVFDVTTGVPHAIASMTGSPNPSYKETKTNAFAPLYKGGKSAVFIYPVNITRSDKPNS